MSRPPQEHKIICTSCGFANYPRANYCVECEAPLSAHSVNDPFDTIKTTGWAYRRSQEKPRSFVVVVGVWLIFGPMFIYSAVTLLEVLPQGLRQLRGPGERIGLLLFLALLGIGLYIPFTIIRRTTVGYLQQRERERREREANDDADDDETGGEFDDDDDD